MTQQVEGSQAVAQAVALCRPEVMACYPISPQTHIVEALSRKVFFSWQKLCTTPLGLVFPLS
jgi:pyruvate/2-oxoacid:ferredoxin oxidoreductase alpha subunit